jgi:murein DD-endopeptidase MepM/ murein hydrolase activator NlpD
MRICRVDKHSCPVKKMNGHHPLCLFLCLYTYTRLQKILTPGQRILRSLFLGLSFCSLLGALVTPTFPLLAAQNTLYPDNGEVGTYLYYQVLPGQNLAEIATRFGTTVHLLSQLNGLQSPAHIYPGQVLQVAIGWSDPTRPINHISLVWGETFLDVSRRYGLNWEQLALANRLLHPTGLPVGYNLVVPDAGHNTTLVGNAHIPLSVLPTAAALMNHTSLLQIQRLNSYPIPSSEVLVIPLQDDASSTGQLPSPILEVRMNTQPLIRGTAAYVILTTAEKVTCTVNFQDQHENCYPESTVVTTQLRYTALLGLSPLLDSGMYTATFSLQPAAGDAVSFSLPLQVTAGQYDYERIDLPPDRESLLDPALSQLEQSKITALRTVRTPEKYWSLPFGMPLPGNVTSYYGSRRSYGYGFTSFHAGTDFRAEVGVPVIAPVAGIVALAEPLVVRGNAVILDHGWGVMSGYWHLSRIDVEVGQQVGPGDIIGAVGNTGLSTGPHLHWELWVNGVPVSPLAWVHMDTLTVPQE